MSETEDVRKLLEGVGIERVEVVQVKNRMVINSISLNNGFTIHLAPSTVGVIINKWEETPLVKQNSTRNSTKNRTQARSTSRKQTTSGRKGRKWTVKASRKSTARLPRV